MSRENLNDERDADDYPTPMHFLTDAIWTENDDESLESSHVRQGNQRNDSTGQTAPRFRNQHTGSRAHDADQTGSNASFIPTIGLKLDDIIASFKPFKGDGHSNIDKWLLHFEEQCCIFNLSEMQKFIFAKRVLKGVAKSFVDHESSAVTWRELKNELRREFNQPVNSVLVHQKLAQRKKKSTESYLEYLYEMLELGSQGGLDAQAIFTHTINGISGPAHLKSFLFDARDLQEFKRKLKSFEVQQNQLQQSGRKTDDKNSKGEAKSRCFNCGDRSHDTNSCPNVGKGPKCFQCNLFGHLSKNCSNKPAERKRMNIINEPKKKRVRKEVLINGFKVTALVDSGSDVSTINESTAKKHNIPYEYLNETVQGVGGFEKLLGKFAAKIFIDKICFEIDCYVLSSENINEEMRRRRSRRRKKTGTFYVQKLKKIVQDQVHT